MQWNYITFSVSNNIWFVVSLFIVCLAGVFFLSLFYLLKRQTKRILGFTGIGSQDKKNKKNKKIKMKIKKNLQIGESVTKDI